jgi:DNA-directed RNA polymerase subunit K/omega
MRPTADQEEAGAASAAPAPITSRFLFVDIAAQRAKQLRRGARPRLAGSGERVSSLPHKLERVAMEEVRSGLIEYALPTGYDGAGGAGKS